MPDNKRINETDLLAELNQIKKSDLKKPVSKSPIIKSVKAKSGSAKKGGGPGRPAAKEEYVRASFSIPARHVSILQHIAAALVPTTGKPVSMSEALRAILDSADPETLARSAAKKLA